jgi:hypothetical protein
LRSSALPRRLAIFRLPDPHQAPRPLFDLAGKLVKVLGGCAQVLDGLADAAIRHRNKRLPAAPLSCNLHVLTMNKSKEIAVFLGANKNPLFSLLLIRNGGRSR